MKISSTIAIILFAVSEAVVAKITPAGLTCEYLKNPMVIDNINPRLSWINTDSAFTRGQFQSAWQIRVAGSRRDLILDKADLWKKHFEDVIPENINDLRNDPNGLIIFNGQPDKKYRDDKTFDPTKFVMVAQYKNIALYRFAN